MWSDEFSLPVQRGSEPLRIVVREYERYLADPPRMWGEQMVYADIVEVWPVGSSILLDMLLRFLPLVGRQPGVKF